MTNVEARQAKKEHAEYWAERLQKSNPKFVVNANRNGTINIDRNSYPHGTVEFDLITASSDELPLLNYVMGSPTRVIGLQPGATVRIRITQNSTRMSKALIIGASCRGLVVIDGTSETVTMLADPRAAEEAPEDKGEVQLDAGSLRLIPGEGDLVVLRITQDDEQERQIRGIARTLLLDGSVDIVDDFTLQTLDVRGSSEIRSASSIEIDSIKGVSSAESKLKVGSYTLSPTNKGQSPTITCSSCDSLTISGSAFLILHTTRNASFSEPEMRVEIGNHGTNLHLSGSTLRFGSERVVAAGVHGSVTLGNLNGGVLVGHPDHGLWINDVKADNEKQKPLAGCQLENVRFYNGLPGLKFVLHAADARRIEPDPRGLPGWGLGIWPTVLRAIKGGPINSPLYLDRVELSYDADLMRQYFDLIRERGASGSATTKVGWCAQRLRHLLARGFWENTALWGYRLLGYGERPGPALLTWIAASLLFVALLHAEAGFQPDAAGAWNLLRFWLEDAASPVGTIVGTGSTSSESAWVYLARALTTIPLVVGALALRKYTRAQ